MIRLSKQRSLAVFLFFLSALILLLGRLAYLQLFHAPSLQSLAKNQSDLMIQLEPVRGKIVDRKNRELALDVRLDSLYAESRNIQNKEELAAKLSKILGFSESYILERLRRDKMFVWIVRRIPAAQTRAIQELKIQGLGFVKESMRVYPKNKTACQLIGFTGIDNNGLEGVELDTDSLLKGVPGWRLSQRDAKQRELISKELETVPPVNGYNVHLAIDEVVQFITEKELAAACEKHSALGGSIVVMDPKTGDVLAMATYPLYDLNNARNAKPEHRRNRAVTDLYEPGSVFKAITLSGILEEKTISLEEKFHCENGSWAVAGKVLHDHKGHGVMSLREIIEKSSNIGTVKAAMKQGQDRIYKYIKLFGFGEKTRIALPGEISGIVPHPRSWSRSSIINIPIGHGVAVTTVQLAAGFAAIANDGVLMKPRILAYIDDENGHVIKKFETEKTRRVISKEAALQVRTVLEGVVSRGTGKKAAVAGFKSAGKTGTAQKLLPGGGYSHDAFIASFVGFVPYDEPRLVIAVSIDEPRPVYYGGEVAAPVFSKIAGQVLSYWQVPPIILPAAKAVPVAQ